MNEPILSINDLSKTIDGIEIIKNCNIQLNTGNIYGILGANGAGKTTLFKLILGILEPSTGNINAFGLNFSNSRNEILKNIGSIIDYPIFYEHLSADKNLEIHLSYMETGSIDIKSVMDMVGLRTVGTQKVSTFSMGMRQRLAIARAIIHKPKLLILDEPINGLDPMGIKEIRELILKLKDGGTTILISSHILSEIEHVADTVVVISDGVIKDEVLLSDAKKQHSGSLEEYFFDIMTGDDIFV